MTVVLTVGSMVVSKAGKTVAMKADLMAAWKVVLLVE